MKKLIFSYVLRLAIFFLVAAATAWLWGGGRYLYALVLSVALIGFGYRFIATEIFLLRQLDDFIAAAKHKDFTRQYPGGGKRAVERRLFTALNKVNEVYRQISSENETQQAYRDRVLNMLDSAIIFYHVDSERVLWVNDAFKRLFELPYLGTLSRLRKKNPGLFKKTVEMEAGRSQVDVLNSSKGKIKLLIQVAEYSTQEGRFRLGVFQNINETIDETENQAWHKLLRVLTHEIMNSIGPISSLAETLHQRLEQRSVGAEAITEVDELKEGVSAIKRRSEGLLQFAASYRMINKVDQPQFAEITVVKLLEDVYRLLEPTLQKKGISLEVMVPDTHLTLWADRGLIEQVLINLLFNAFEAVKDAATQPRVTMQAGEREGRLLLRITDNGRGMLPEVQEQIFTPFFTTKKSGTGVGLTLSKQIMLLHGGNLLAESEPGIGSVFTLQFRQRRTR